MVRSNVEQPNVDDGTMTTERRKTERRKIERGKIERRKAAEAVEAFRATNLTGLGLNQSSWPRSF